MFDSFQPIAAIATTPQALQLLQRLPQLTIWAPLSLQDSAADASVRAYPASLKDHLVDLWDSHAALVFCLATGAVVRLIAPLLQHKATDPAIVVVDEAGQFVISLCGGHQAGADRLTQLIALQLGATPIVTGAAHHLNLPGIDILGHPFGWKKGPGDWTRVSAAIARQAPVEVRQEAGSRLWQTALPADHPFQWDGSEGAAEVQDNRPVPQARVWISPIVRQVAADADLPNVQWYPRVLWIGIGCERGTAKSVIVQAIQQVLQAHHFAPAAIAGMATIDLKADEVGIVEVCQEQGWPLRCFPAQQLTTVAVPTPSEVVATEVGTPSVAEAAALVAAGLNGGHLRVAKQIVRVAGQPGAVTIAVAEAEQEYLGRTGKLWLVGTGPGELAQMTPAAQTAIAAADVVIGYSLYIDLIRPLLQPGQIIEAKPITQERQRAERAIALAEWGLTVAVVSSGDCGIYGMAGLVLEQLQVQGWDGKTPEVQVFPGITALQATASRVGAPLMHDFCAISLSDLLTPWDVIHQRLIAAAEADFVVALYNPKSQHRIEQITIAQRIFLKYRQGCTPVAIVRSVYRPEEHITITTLAEMLESPIDMLTTVLIGNQSSRTHANWIITPRGYLGEPR